MAVVKNVITQPTLIKFLIPTTIEEFDATTEPTLEGIAGEDYLGNTIASGGQAINAMDSHPHRTFQADTAAVATEWRIDLALDGSESVGFVLVDGHNLASAYPPVGISSLVDVYHNSADNFGTATKIASYLKQITDQIAKDTNFYLGEFTAVSKQYWFIDFNEDGNTGTATDALIGQVVLGRVYTFNGLTPEGGYSGEYGYPGIISRETDAGLIQAERKYGKRPQWDIGFAISSDSQFEDLQEMIDIVQNGLYPFYIAFDYDQSSPVVWRVRMDGGLSWSYVHGPDDPWRPTITIIADV